MRRRRGQHGAAALPAVNYYFDYRPGTLARAEHLRDESEFLSLARSSTDETCKLKPVSFVKPIGLENEHPGYTSVAAARITSSPC